MYLWINWGKVVSYGNFKTDIKVKDSWSNHYYSVLIGLIMGARVGSKFSLKTKPAWLEIGLAVCTVISAILVLIKGVF